MVRVILYAPALLLFILACQNSAPGKNRGYKNQQNPASQSKQTASSTTPLVTIDLQPFSGMPGTEVNYVYTELMKVYPHIVLKQPVALPQSAFYSPRNRYKADLLLSF